MLFARWVAGGRAKSPSVMGVSGEIEVSADWRSNSHLFVQGAVPVGREFPKSGK